ncbi:MAG: hypothetical protein R3D60_08260 [Paracoccaceae bacterium]
MKLRSTVVTSVLCGAGIALVATVLLPLVGYSQNKFYGTPNRGTEGARGNAQINMLMDENMARKSETTQNASDIDVLEGRMGTAEGDISALEASQTAQDTQIGNNSTTISSNTGRIGTLEAGMADVEPHAKAAIPEPPSRPERVGNLHKPDGGTHVPLQLKISPELRREYRAFAADNDLGLSELFRIVWEHYRRTAS